MNDKTTEAYELRTQLKSARLIIKDQKDRLAAAESTIKRYEEALEKLARLGNEPLLGNSDGNMIARKALLEK